MNLHSIRWRLPLSYAAIALLAALALGSVMLLVLNSYYTGMERDYLTDNARGFQPMVEKVLKTNLPDQFLQDQVMGLSFLSRTQIRVLDNNGETIADSGIPGVDQMVAVSGAPVVRHFNMAVNGPPSGGSGAVIIFSKDAQSVPAPAVPLDEQPFLPTADTVYAVSASPFGYGFAVKGDIVSERRSSQVISIPLDGSLGTLEISNGPAYGSDILRSVAIAWVIAGILSIALAALAGLYASKQVTQPVLMLTDAAHQMEGGNLSARVALPDEKQQEFTALAHAFNGMAAQVENTVSTLRAFVSDAAHELNTPLTALKTNLELAATEADAAQRQEFLSRALEQNQRLEKLTSNLLDLSRIEAPDAASTFESLDLRQLVAQIGERFASRADQANRNFNLTLPDSEAIILGNATQLDRAMSNLFENALKFTPEDGNISLTLEKSENAAILTITDTGIGIPPEDLPHLFERFHRGRNSSPYPGNGLGLAIVKASVTAHKGSIQVESLVGQGTSIIIQLPLVK